MEVHFTGQKSDEEVIALFRKSIWSYYRLLSISLALLILPWVIHAYLHYPLVTSIIIIVFWLIAITILSRIWYLWANTMYLVTNLRVIALVQSGFFFRNFSESFLKDICQVTAYVDGAMPSTFGYGNVLVQTQGEQWLKDVSRPYDAKEAIFDAIHSSQMATKGKEVKDYRKFVE